MTYDEWWDQSSLAKNATAGSRREMTAPCPVTDCHYTAVVYINPVEEFTPDCLKPYLLAVIDALTIHAREDH